MKRVLTVLLAIAVIPLAAAHTSAATFAPECEPTGTIALRIGAVGCRRFDSAAMGGITAFSYFVPPNCDPVAHPGRRCPALYWLHGANGTYRSLGPVGSTTAPYARALSAGPPVDPKSVDDPWNYSDQSTWVPRAPLDMIIVFAHGATLLDGRGPGGSGTSSSAWADWNARYAKDGDTPRYDTAPPQVRKHLFDELIPYIDATFPTIDDRTGRAMVGRSLGGLGSFHNGLAHPDAFASLGMVSGLSFPFPDPIDRPVTGGLPQILPVAPTPYAKLPGVAPAIASDVAWSPELDGLLSGYGSLFTVGMGDLVADGAWWRRHNPGSLASNARAYDKRGNQVLHLRYFHGDSIPRRPEDFTDPVGFLQAQPVEAIDLTTNLHLESVFDQLGVKREFMITPGIHNQTYANVWLRQQYEAQYAHLRHWDGSGQPPAPPVRFDYRAVDKVFDVWGWHVTIKRTPIEFLDLTDVSCDAITLRGTGVVTVTVPAKCGTGAKGKRTFTVDLNPQHATDEIAGASASTAYGRTVTVRLS